jgi:hypothetical protein
MDINKPIEEKNLAALAKKFRQAAGKSKAEAARELKVKAPTIFGAEEYPKMGLSKLRIRMIEKYSPYRVTGPVYLLHKK